MNIVIIGSTSSIHYYSDLYVGGFKKNFIFRRKNEKLGNFFLFRNVPEQRATSPFFSCWIRDETGIPEGVSSWKYQRLGYNLQKHENQITPFFSWDFIVSVVQMLMAIIGHRKFSERGVGKFWCCTRMRWRFRTSRKDNLREKELNNCYCCVLADVTNKRSLQLRVKFINYLRQVKIGNTISWDLSALL